MGERKKEKKSGPRLSHSPFAVLAGRSAPAGEAPEEATSEAGPRGDAERPFEEKVVLRREKKGRGGKTVTRVQGIRPAHREALMKRMRRALGCGAVVEGEDVVLLGAVVDRAAAFLEREGAPRVVRGN